MPKYINQFSRPDHYDHTILDDQDKVVGTLRFKPSSVLWAPTNSRKFFAVPLDKFTAWIAVPCVAQTGAARLDRGRVEDFRNQSPRQVLLAHPRWTQSPHR